MVIYLLQECNCYLLLFELAFSLCTIQEMHMWYIQINSCRIQVFQGIQGSSKNIRRVTFFYCIAKCFGVYRNTSQLKRVCLSLLLGARRGRDGNLWNAVPQTNCLVAHLLVRVTPFSSQFYKMAV